MLQAEQASRLFGRGDGSLLTAKFTGLEAFVRESQAERVEVLRVANRAFTSLGSKGAVAALLRVDGATTVCFVTCHMEAHSNDLRRAQYRLAQSALGQRLGEAGWALNCQAHHVIWCGDLNYRCVAPDGGSVASDTILGLLREGRNRECFERHDQLRQEMRGGEAFHGFREPVPLPDFVPTYKKFEKRGAVGMARPDWAERTYRTRYREPFYKGGKVKERVPGYCDRVLFHSLPDLRDRLRPEPVLVELQPLHEAGARSIGTAAVDNYRSINEGEGMDVSDHSPVCAAFELAAPAAAAAQEEEEEPRRVAEAPGAAAELCVYVSDFTAVAGQWQATPEGIDVLFPLPHEARSAHAAAGACAFDQEVIRGDFGPGKGACWAEGSGEGPRESEEVPRAERGGARPSESVREARPAGRPRAGQAGVWAEEPTSSGSSRRLKLRREPGDKEGAAGDASPPPAGTGGPADGEEGRGPSPEWGADLPRTRGLVLRWRGSARQLEELHMAVDVQFAQAKGATARPRAFLPLQASAGAAALGGAASSGEEESAAEEGGRGRNKEGAMTVADGGGEAIKGQCVVAFKDVVRAARAAPRGALRRLSLRVPLTREGLPVYAVEARGREREPVALRVLLELSPLS